ncbi:histidine phosphatase family protein [Evansella cellulosilytica]|uniref:Phosphoglycerate mutase n=1 Tax=Evansella cellulosilytica (strain ATCC 21833 / DSM 2522 / FERM P-1141 / JCM 9156 / N-4) TaxID=649639 RepID=E6TYE9_EVAC2|nr:phosphoglycerate mutase family protein [Evansella cellulosilytica]ADU28887.1 Phosphoglycerate mutase [Evansella cellulosilytica DSM 2522]
MIYVVRHGQTDLNKEDRLQGRLGLPLNEYGMNEAKSLKNKLVNIEFDYVFSSPQERAIKTAEIISGTTPIIDRRIDVYELGEADRLKKSEVKMSGMIPDSSVYKGIEKNSSFVKRIFDFMEELETRYSNKDVNILLIGHRCTTSCIGAFFEGVPSDGNILKYSLRNGEYKVYQFSDNNTNIGSQPTI